MARFVLTLQVSPGIVGGLPTVVLRPTEQPLSGTLLFGAEKGLNDMVDHTLAVETLHGYMLSCCNQKIQCIFLCHLTVQK